MKRIQKLLVPTDLSEDSRRGLVYACAAIQAAAETIQKLRAIARDRGYPQDNGKSESAPHPAKAETNSNSVSSAFLSR